VVTNYFVARQAGVQSIGVGERGHVPPKNREKYFAGNYYVNSGIFRAKNHVKLGNFVNFSGKYHKKFGIFFYNFSGKNHVKFGHFADFNTYFSGKNFVPPLKLTELIRLWCKAKICGAIAPPLLPRTDTGPFYIMNKKTPKQNKKGYCV